MADDELERGGAFPDGFVVPITGLLALLFAVLAGASAYPLVSGAASLQATVTPAIFVIASLISLWLRGKYRTENGTTNDH